LKFVQLTKGYRAQVSDRDYIKVAKFKWQAYQTRRPSGNDAAAEKMFGKFALTNRKILGGYH
jgi:hypothetical protein